MDRAGTTTTPVLGHLQRERPTCPSSLQSSKVLAKRELLCVPLIGWTWYFLEIVFCKRKWEEDRDTVIAGLRCLADYPEYMWVSPCTHGGPGTGGCTGWGHLTCRTVTCITSGKARPIHSRAWGPPAATAPIGSQSWEGGGHLPAQQSGFPWEEWVPSQRPG